MGTHFYPEYAKRQYKIVSLGSAEFGILLGKTKHIPEREGPYSMKQVRLDLYSFLDKHGEKHTVYFFM